MHDSWGLVNFRFGYYTYEKGEAKSEKLLLGMCLKIIYSSVFVWKGDSKNKSKSLGLVGHRWAGVGWARTDCKPVFWVGWSLCGTFKLLCSPWARCANQPNSVHPFLQDEGYGNQSLELGLGMLNEELCEGSGWWYSEMADDTSGHSSTDLLDASCPAWALKPRTLVSIPCIVIQITNLRKIPTYPLCSPPLLVVYDLEEL